MTLTLEQYSDWLSREADKLLRPINAKGKKLIDESNRALQEAKVFFEDLSRKGDKDMTNKHDPVSYRAARVVGHSAREGAQHLSRVQAPREITWENLKGFKDSLSILTRSLREIRASTAAQLSGFYILDMRSFSGTNDRISRQSERLTGFLEGEGTALQKTKTLAGILSDSKSVKREIEEQALETKTLHEKDGVLSSKSTQLSLEVDKLESEPLLKELLEVEKGLRDESRKFRSESLAHLKRPLRRLRELSERGEMPLGVEEREALGMYIRLPYRSFLSNRTGPHIKNILSNLRVALDSGKMGLKPKKATRILARLDQLTSGTDLLDTRSKGRSLLSRRHALLNDPHCKNLYDLRRETTRKLEENRTERQEVQERLRVVKEKSTSLNKRFRELLDLLELKTEEYTEQTVQIERPLLVPPIAG